MADNNEIIICPACHVDMEKVFIQSAGLCLDVCKVCGGIYFDNREFKKFDEAHEQIAEIEAALSNCKYIEVDKDIVRKCPICESDMVKVGKEPTIDECYICGSKFLDGNELQEYRAKFATDADRSKAFEKTLNALLAEKH